MDSLKLTFVNGETVEFPFSKGSTVAVETPDGVNGSQRGVWGEVVGVEYVKDPAVEQPAAPAEPAVDVEPATEDASSDPAPAEAAPATDEAPETPAEEPAATPET
jgi:hypothetical protein